MPAPFVILADIGVVVSLALVAVVFRENTFAAATIRVEAKQHVITTGMYAHVRHPMYACALPYIFAMPVGLGSWWAMLLGVPFALLLGARIVDEERMLIAELPDYADYCRAVRWRLIPAIW